MKFITEVTELVAMVSSMSPNLGVHVRAGGRMGQADTAEQFKLNGAPSSISSQDGVMVGLGTESEEVTGGGRRGQKLCVHTHERNRIY